MRVCLKLLRHDLGVFQQRRSLTTAAVQSTRRYPLKVGGVHYQEGDRVLVIHRDGKRVKSRLVSPLSADSTTRTGLHAYEIKHSDIIGKPAGRLYVQAQGTSKKDKSVSFRVAHPSLEQFIALAPRTVTPIYSSYGATIVSLLDIHVAPPLPSNDPQTSSIPPLEILEAGTGNGGLTLHLARAIAAANPPPPYHEEECSGSELEDAWTQWQSRRRAVIHTVEFLESRSRAAEKLIKSFRGALYWPHINFYSGDAGSWVREEHKRRTHKANIEGGFLDIVILDLPSVHSQVPEVVGAMKEDGQLLVWVPQVTQVAACQQKIERLGLPLKLDQVVELGEGISNGRTWDLRFVKTRAEQRKGMDTTESEPVEELTAQDDTDVKVEDVSNELETGPAAADTEFPTMVCRPMVGNMTIGGGFVGLWRKVPIRGNIEASE